MKWSKLYTFSTLSLGLFPIVKLNHYSLLMMIWVLISLYITIKNKTYKSISKKDYGLIGIMSFPFVALIIYLPLAIDYKTMGNLLNRSLPFLLFSFFFLLNYSFFSKQMLRRTLAVMIVATVMVVLKSWNSIFSEGFGTLWRENSFYNPTFRNIFQNTTHIHLPYLGLICVFASLILVYQCFNVRRINYISIITIIFLLFSVYLFSARMALICFFIGFLGIVIRELKSFMAKVTVFGSMILLIGVAFLYTPMKERYHNLVEWKAQLPNKDMQPHEVNYRYAILHCTQHVLNQHWLMGVGPDNVQKSLNDCYKSFDYVGYDDFQTQTYNSHNQYFDYWMKYGIIGLLSFVGFIGFFIIKGSYYHKLFILLFAINLLTENLFDRQLGVVLFTLFNAIFVVVKKQRFEKSFSS
ncbi:O-antigen ligase family protein [Myroides ceti]|uniref:O-antigen ligase family protein n=1 Tax=Paenimyroides ceti TaxID=395087 RepID=A0ABT8CYB3_9FLAO|nr:O-antigen ligase family protein [Paenimyroides ceti]MDN3708552.1 O-antigen ligase family protein [Paenimyroides ceti]